MSNNQYIVVWRGFDTINGGSVAESEIYGQRLTAAGIEIGTNDFRISDMGLDGNEYFDAFYPALAFNTLTAEYLVTWSGNDIFPSLQIDEVYGQRFIPSSGPLPTPTATSTSSPTPTATSTSSPTPTATITTTPPPTGTSSPTPPGPTPTATNTPTITPTVDPSTIHEIYMPIVVNGG